MSLSINPSKLEVIEHEGLKFFKRFSAVDKNGKNVNLSIDIPDTFTTINLKENAGNQLGYYDLQLDKDENILEGVQIYVNKAASDKNLGQLLTLSSLMEFKLNKFREFKLFSLKEALPFHLKYGFVINNTNPDFILEGLRQIKKSRVPNLDDLKHYADLLIPKLSSNDSFVANDKKTLEKGCSVVSEYIKYLARMGLKKEEPQFSYGTHLKFSTWDFERNKIYLNELLKRHKIDFQF